ncbi:Uncharacterised protein [Vibrio cholerae]|nr:Uncharacterised protein [Vibrio cholerae]
MRENNTTRQPVLRFAVNMINIRPTKPMISSAGRGINSEENIFFSSNIEKTVRKNST